MVVSLYGVKMESGMKPMADLGALFDENFIN